MVPTKKLHSAPHPNWWKSSSPRCVCCSSSHSEPVLRAFLWLRWASGVALLSIFWALFAIAIPPADDPGTHLKGRFESAKSALATGDFHEAERQYGQTIALGLRQLANLSVSE